MAPSQSDSKALAEILNSTVALLGQFTAALKPNPSATCEDSTSAPIADPPNPLRVLSDAARLLKAHTTKLSLLAINAPFTPSAVAKIVRELAGTCLPAMMGGVQLCTQQQRRMWGQVMAQEAQARVRRTFIEVEALLREIQVANSGDASDEPVMEVGAMGSARRRRRDSLATTGVVWEACDALVELEALGVAGLAVRQAEQFRDTVKDAIAELQEWREGEDLESEGRGDGLLDSDDEGVDGDRDSIEDIFHAANSMPRDRPELKRLVTRAEATLRKVAILYTAVSKRRLAAFKSLPSDDVEEPVVFRLDRLLLHLKRIPHQVDELAGCFYDLDEQGAKECLAKCTREATNASREAERDWDGGEDKYSEWFSKWRAAVADGEHDG